MKPKTRLGKAARFIYLNRFCFNGLYRTNAKGHFNVPIGEKTGEIPSIDHFIMAAQRLKSAELLRADFEKTISTAKAGDLVYLDPPYASVTTKDRNEYGIGSFKPRDISRLIQSLRILHEKGAHFILSYSTAPDFIAQLPQKKLRTQRVRRTIASNPVFRTSTPEVLLKNGDLF